MLSIHVKKKGSGVLYNLVHDLFHKNVPFTHFYIKSPILLNFSSIALTKTKLLPWTKLSPNNYFGPNIYD